MFMVATWYVDIPAGTAFTLAIQCRMADNHISQQPACKRHRRDGAGELPESASASTSILIEAGSGNQGHRSF